jgi:hypothetical protein
MYRDMVQGRAVALIGRQIDPTFELFLPPNGVARRIKDPPPYFDGGLSLTTRPLLIAAFRPETAGYYRIRFQAFGLQNVFGRFDHPTGPRQSRSMQKPAR